MFDQFTDLVADASHWAYLVVFVLAVVDDLLPIVPSETAVITAGVVAAGGDLSLPLVLVAAAAGAFLGDNTAYGIGRTYGRRPNNRLLRTEKSRRRLLWAKRHLEERGGELIAVARFIPAGRTAVTVSAGLTAFPWPRFARYDGVAAVLWAGYAGCLGYFGGRAFEDQAWKGLLLALGVAFAITIVIEVVRWFLRRRQRATA
jgi:membrane protein DedA with SNARE-associated domain